MAKQTSSRTKTSPTPSTIKHKPTPATEAPAASAARAPSIEKPLASAKPALSASKAAPSHEQIARRAYELFETRAHAEGNALHDWLRAETDLRAN
jgi:Protein of unknown function (DUF2934)